MVTVFLFDYGGVLAEEGFRNGLVEIARRNRLDPESFYRTADELIYDTGYLTGKADESAYWQAVRGKTGISGTDGSLREMILDRFIARPAMVGCVERLHAAGFSTALLSDQTDWLEELDRKNCLFRHFDRVFNSYRTGRSKRDPETFMYVCRELKVKPEHAVFIDDNAGHIERAAQAGMIALRFTSIQEFNDRISSLVRVRCGNGPETPASAG